MDCLWDDAEVARAATAVALRVYPSRRSDRDSPRVLHGGGNTSGKAGTRNAVTPVTRAIVPARGVPALEGFASALS